MATAEAGRQAVTFSFRVSASSLSNFPRLTQNSEDQQRVEDRVQRFQARLVAQYTAMDASLSRLNSLSSYVTQQLAALSRSNSNSA